MKRITILLTILSLNLFASDRYEIEVLGQAEGDFTPCTEGVNEAENNYNKSLNFWKKRCAYNGGLVRNGEIVININEVLRSEGRNKYCYITVNSRFKCE